MWRELLHRFGVSHDLDLDQAKQDELEPTTWPGKRSAVGELELPPADLRAHDLLRLRGALASMEVGGAALPSTSASFGALLGADLSRTSIHTSGPASEAAARLGAEAFTHGSHVAF